MVTTNQNPKKYWERNLKKTQNKKHWRKTANHEEIDQEKKKETQDNYKAT